MILLSGIDPSSVWAEEITRYAKAYIERYGKMVVDDENGGYLENNTNLWVEDIMFDLVDYSSEKIFLIIDEILQQSDDDTVICNLAAGPLEDLLMRHGETVLPYIEARADASAKNCDKFRELFDLIYQVVSDELWERIVSLVGGDCDEYMS